MGKHLVAFECGLLLVGVLGVAMLRVEAMTSTDTTYVAVAAQKPCIAEGQPRDNPTLELRYWRLSNSCSFDEEVTVCVFYKDDTVKSDNRTITAKSSYEFAFPNPKANPISRMFRVGYRGQCLARR